MLSNIAISAIHTFKAADGILIDNRTREPAPSFSLIVRFMDKLES